MPLRGKCGDDASQADFAELTDGRWQVTCYGVKSIQRRDMFYFVAYVGDQVASQNAGYGIEAHVKNNIDSTYAYFNR